MSILLRAYHTATGKLMLPASYCTVTLPAHGPLATSPYTRYSGNYAVHRKPLPLNRAARPANFPMAGSGNT
eukprot:XP_001694143.1 predicted protein [Chlamydomonas reinhardtii]